MKTSTVIIVAALVGLVGLGGLMWSRQSQPADQEQEAVEAPDKASDYAALIEHVKLICRTQGEATSTGGAESDRLMAEQARLEQEYEQMAQAYTQRWRDSGDDEAPAQAPTLDRMRVLHCAVE